MEFKAFGTFGKPTSSRVEGVPVALNNQLVRFEPFRPDPALPEEMISGPAEHQELSYSDLVGLDQLDGFYNSWRKARSVNARSAAMHRAVLEVQPRIADLWVPNWSFHRRNDGRRRFRDSLRAIWMLRQRGFDPLAWGFFGVLGIDSPVGEREDVPARQVPRRCEGRSRAPGASGGGSRRGGSRRGGGDRGDDSGSGGSDSSGGDGSSSPGRRSRFWRFVAGLALITGIVGSLYTPVSDLFASAQPTVEREVIRREVILREPASAEPGVHKALRAHAKPCSKGK